MLVEEIFGKFELLVKVLFIFLKNFYNFIILLFSNFDYII